MNLNFLAELSFAPLPDFHVVAFQAGVMTDAERLATALSATMPAVPLRLDFFPLRVEAASTQQCVARPLMTVFVERGSRQKILTRRAPEVSVCNLTLDPARAQITSDMREGDVI